MWNPEKWLRTSRQAVTALLVLIVVSVPLRVIAAPDRGAVEVAVAHSIENAARMTIARYVPMAAFNVKASVTLGELPADPVPYLPNTVAPGILAKQPVERLVKMTSRVALDIFVANDVPEEARAKIKDFLIQDLKLDLARGDAIAVDIFEPFAAAAKDEKSVREILRIDAEVRAARTRAEDMRRDRDDVKNELQLAKAELDRVAREKAEALAKSAEAVKEGVEKKKDEAPPPEAEGWLSRNLLIAITMVLLLLAAFVLGRSFMTAGKALGAAVSLIARALESVGGAIGNLSPSGGPDSLTLNGSLEGGQGAGAGMTSNAIEALYARVLELHTELTTSLDEDNEHVVLKHISTLLANTAAVPRAVLTMELLGKDRANELFKKLGLEDQERVIRFMNTGSYGQNKAEGLVQVGEELKTKLMATGFDKQRADLDQELAKILLQVSPSELPALVQTIDPTNVPRLLLYLDVVTISTLFTKMAAIDTERFTLIATHFSKIADSVHDMNVDARLRESVDHFLKTASENVQRPFLKLYQEVLESVDEDASEVLLKGLMSDARVGSYLASSITVVDLFFEIPENLQREILDALTIKDVAGLLFGTREDRKLHITRALPERRLEMMEEEVERLTSMSPRAAAQHYRRARTAVVAYLKKLKAEGAIGGNTPARDGELPPVPAAA